MMDDAPASALIRRICHDLTQPLTALQGCIELALHLNQSPEEMRQSLLDAGEEAERITELMRAVRSYAEAMGPLPDVQRVSLQDILADAIRELPLRDGSDGPAMFVELDPRPVTVQADTGRLKTALQRILDFSLTHAATPFTISLENRSGGGEVLIAGRASKLTGIDCASLFDPHFQQPAGKHVSPTERFRMAAAALTIQRTGGTVLAEPGKSPGYFVVRVIFEPRAD